MSDIARNTVLGRGGRELLLTKIFWDNGYGGKTGQITLSQNYGGQNMGVLSTMFDVTRHDFPNAGLDLSTVNAVVLGGQSRAGMWGIEFHLPANTAMPEDYSNSRSELILSGGM